MKKRILDNIEYMPSGNREMKAPLIRKLKESIKEYGILRSVVVANTNIFGGKKRYYIADGQHLYRACEALNMLDSLSFIEVQRKFKNITEIVEFVSTLNTSQSPWRLQDFVEAYASTNQYISYNKLVQKRLSYDLSYNMLAIIYSGKTKGQASKAIKSGNFRIGDKNNGEARSDEMAAIILELSGKDFFGRTNSTDLVVFAYVFYKWYTVDTYNQERLLEYIKENITEFVGAEERDMFDLLNEFSENHGGIRYPKFGS